MEFFNQLQDGWTIYLWLVAGAAIIVASIIAIRWAAKNDQFDEDIKYVVFDESDKDKMSKEEFDKAMQVNKEQEEQRKEALSREREKRAQSRKAS
jgi:hypothetical protein